jgi:O-6-methylguanine DNA methyltransferase
MAKKVEYGFADSPFGEIIVARTWDGICDLQFLGFNRMGVIHELAQRWGTYTHTTQSDEMANTVQRVLFEGYDHPLNLDLRGTEFQLKVWKAIMQVPFGETISYQQLAANIGQPEAVRAVATAVGQNPMAVIIPCHRIIHKDGTIGEYHWGRELKEKLLEWEKARKS